MNFDFNLMRKGNLLLLIAILINLLIIINAGGRNTNIVLTKDTIVLNDRHKKHSNNIVIKDGHKDEHHHCNCHYPMHHYEPHHHDHGWDHWHKRSDLVVSPSNNNNWFDMQMAASNQFQQQHKSAFSSNQQHTSSAFAFNNENTKFINGNGNEAINQLLKQRYLQPVKFNLAELQNLQLPVFVKNEN